MLSYHSALFQKKIKGMKIFNFNNNPFKARFLKIKFSYWTYSLALKIFNLYLQIIFRIKIKDLILIINRTKAVTYFLIMVWIRVRLILTRVNLQKESGKDFFLRGHWIGQITIISIRSLKIYRKKREIHFLRIREMHLKNPLLVKLSKNNNKMFQIHF